MAARERRARFRMVSVAVFDDERFLGWSDAARALWMYLRFGPLTGPIPGLSRVGVADVADRMERSIVEIERALGEIVASGAAEYDARARLLWVPGAIEEEPPGAPANVLGWSWAWAELRDSPAKRRAFDGLFTWCSARGERWVEALLRATGEPDPSETEWDREAPPPPPSPPPPPRAKEREREKDQRDPPSPPGAPEASVGDRSPDPPDAWAAEDAFRSALAVGEAREAAEAERRSPKPSARPPLPPAAVPIAHAIRESTELREAGVRPGRLAAIWFGAAAGRGYPSGFDLGAAAREAVAQLATRCATTAGAIDAPSRARWAQTVFLGLLTPAALEAARGGGRKPRGGDQRGAAPNDADVARSALARAEELAAAERAELADEDRRRTT